MAYLTELLIVFTSSLLYLYSMEMLNNLLTATGFMPVLEGRLLNILELSAAGMLLALLVFAVFVVICQAVMQEKPYRLVSLDIYIKEFFSLIVIVVISLFIINFLFYKYGFEARFFAGAVFAYSLLLLAAIDFKTQLLPDVITKPLILLGIIQGYAGVFTSLQSAILGAFAGYMVLWLVNYVFRLVKGIDGMGYGDFKLLAAIGAWGGVGILPLVILSSSILGVVIALIIIKYTKSSINTPTPFGPSLVITGFIAIIYGREIISWYVSLLQT